MRYAELSFLVLLVAYHCFLLLPRSRRPFAANYLVFLAGMALAWNLGMEGLRWQTLPPTGLLLVDLALLFPTFSTLRGKPSRKGVLGVLFGTARTLLALIGLTVALGGAALAVGFPLPKVELTGGISPGYREIRLPPSGEHPGLNLRLWYPAAGNLQTKVRPSSEVTAWQEIRVAGGLPVFWQSYLGNLPSSLIQGGRMAASGTKYPVVYAAFPKGENPEDFGYLFEDLASRGFIVAAGTELVPAVSSQPTFDWSKAWTELRIPFEVPSLWLEPELTLSKNHPIVDTSMLISTRDAMRQLDDEPGDLFFSAIDWGHQAFWAWGSGPGPSLEQRQALAFRGELRFGTLPDSTPPVNRELWISEGAEVEKLPAGRWVLATPSLHRADISDAAYLKPMLVLAGLKNQADAGFHGALRQYQAAFFQFALWGSGSDMAFGQTVPEVPGLILSGK